MKPLLRPATRLALLLRLNELGPLLSLAGLSFFAFTFVKLAGEVQEGDTALIDRVLLLALRNPADLADPIGPSWVEESARDITGLGGYAILGMLTLATVAYLLLARKRAAALLVVGAIVGGMLLSTALKIGFE